MSVPDSRPGVTKTPATSASRVRADGTRIFRMAPPQVIWWGWAGIVVLSLADYLIQAHRFPSLEFALGALAITGLVFACAQWPMVIADEHGIEIRNPVRTFFVPWVAVRGIYLADSVEVECARLPPRKTKTVYSWALSSPRRSRARAQLRGWQWDQGKRNRPSGYNQLPDPAKALAKMTTAEIMARELATMSEEARFRSVMVDVDLTPGQESGTAAPLADAGQLDAGQLEVPQAGGEVLEARWSWLPIAVFAVPAIAFLIVVLVR
ncbi:MAG TPA: PH domain-containing protein [Streptosporangiaceae bacterium]|nr:PH domain-containing protein [Streptosporangiaceae bacterium]